MEKNDKTCFKLQQSSGFFLYFRILEIINNKNHVHIYTYFLILLLDSVLNHLHLLTFREI